MFTGEEDRPAVTPEEMRAEIFRLERYEPLVRNVMEMANYKGLSSEDRYTILAYLALQQRHEYQKRCFEFSKFTPHPIFIPIANCSG